MDWRTPRWVGWRSSRFRRPSRNGSVANNTASYLGGAAGVALVVALATANETAGAAGLLHGWDTAATVCAVLCLVSSVIAVLCRPRAQPA